MQFLIYGSRSFGLTVSSLIEDCGYQVLGMLDDQSPGEKVVGTFEDACRQFPRDSVAIALGIGYNDLAARWQAWQRIRCAGWSSPALVHPRAFVSRSAQLGEGTLVMAGAIVDRQVHIGEASVLWPGACVNDDVKVGANTFVSPNATLCGEARIGAHSFIGAGAVLADGAVVPEGSFVKMGTAYAVRFAA